MSHCPGNCYAGCEMWRKFQRDSVRTTSVGMWAGGSLKEGSGRGIRMAIHVHEVDFLQLFLHCTRDWTLLD